MQNNQPVPWTCRQTSGQSFRQNLIKTVGRRTGAFGLHPGANALAAGIVVAPQNLISGCRGNIKQIFFPFGLPQVKITPPFQCKHARQRNFRRRSAGRNVAKIKYLASVRIKGGSRINRITVQSPICRPRRFSGHNHQQIFLFRALPIAFQRSVNGNLLHRTAAFGHFYFNQRNHRPKIIDRNQRIFQRLVVAHKLSGRLKTRKNIACPLPSVIST